MLQNFNSSEHVIHKIARIPHLCVFETGSGCTRMRWLSGGSWTRQTFRLVSHAHLLLCRHALAMRMPATDGASMTGEVRARQQCSLRSYLTACRHDASCGLHRSRGGLAGGPGGSTLGGFLGLVQSSLGRATAQAAHSKSMA